MTEMLTKEQLLKLLTQLSEPQVPKISEARGSELLREFCMGCPDPVKARRLVVESLDPMTNEELVDRALAMPVRRMADIPFSEIAANHPLRKMFPN